MARAASITFSRMARRPARASAVPRLALVCVGSMLGLAYWMGSWWDRASTRRAQEDAARFVASGSISEQRFAITPRRDGDANRPEQRAWARVFVRGRANLHWNSDSEFELVVGGHRALVLCGAGLELWNEASVRPGSSWSDRDALDTDLTGDGVSEVVVQETTDDGAGFCHARMHVCRLWPRPHVQTLDLPWSHVRVLQADQDAALELKVLDDPLGIAGLRVPLTDDLDACVPSIILKFDGADWSPAAALNFKREEACGDLCWPAPDTVPLWEAGRQREAPPKWMGNVIALVYAGHASQAWEALRALWPSHPGWPARVRADLIAQLRRVRSWPMLLEMNGSALED